MHSHRVRTLVLVAVCASLLTLGSAALAAPTHGRHPGRAPRHVTRTHHASVRRTDPVVGTNAGPVRGMTTNGVTEFLGIPYAAPPVGSLRWRPPQPHARWYKPLDATQYGPTCPQVTELGVFANGSTSENCLYLNVFTPKLGHPGKRGLPVFVWIHGGGNIDGESNDYDGAKLATGGRYGGSNTIVVTLNYRLGLLGFMANPALANSNGQQDADFGLMDQQAALRWVKQNIAAFGGDPNNVTLGGQSAGASDTDANMISPLSKGLFEHGIAESVFSSAYTPMSTALSEGESFAKAAGCTGTNAAIASCLRSLPVSRILQLQGTANTNGPYVTGNPITGGPVVPLTPHQAFSTGQYNHMPLMGGNVQDEGNFLIATKEYFTLTAVTAADFTNYITTTFSPPTFPAGTAAKVMAQYPLANYATPQLALDAVETAPLACSSLENAGLLARRVPTYAYTFDYQHAPFYFPAMPGFVPLAAHTIDIQFLFPGYHGGSLGVNLDQTTGQPRELNTSEGHLSNELVAAWTNFALTGNPNRAGNAPWPKFNSTPGAPAVLSENIPSLSTRSAAQVSAAYHCSLWDPILAQDPNLL